MNEKKEPKKELSLDEKIDVLTKELGRLANNKIVITNKMAQINDQLIKSISIREELKRNKEK